jgi:hypothetical protein
MARARLISKTLSTSARFAQLFEAAGDLAEFAQSLYPLLVVHADDFGREEADAPTVKYRFHPRSPRSVVEFGAALDALAAVGLIRWYEADGRRCYQIEKFEAHQAGLQRRTKSQFPEPPGGSVNFTEVQGSSENLQEIPAELNRSEENRRSKPKVQRCALSIDTVRRHLMRAVHAQLDEAPETPISELAEQIKDLGRPLGFTWNTGREITAIIEAVLGRRAKATGT